MNPSEKELAELTEIIIRARECSETVPQSLDAVLGFFYKHFAEQQADLEKFTAGGLLDCHMICDQRDKAVQERDRLTTRLAEVEKALKQYGQHLSRCTSIVSYKGICSCGLEQLLTSAPSASLNRVEGKE